MIDRKEDNQFHLVSKYEPSGDQPQAIEALVENIEGGEKAQILKGATGTGKTYTMSQVIQRVNKPLPSLPGMGFGANDAVRPFLDAMVFTTDLYVTTSSAD